MEGCIGRPPPIYKAGLKDETQRLHISVLSKRDRPTSQIQLKLLPPPLVISQCVGFKRKLNQLILQSDTKKEPRVMLNLSDCGRDGRR